MDEGEFETLFRGVVPQLMRYAEAQLDWATAQDVVMSAMTTMWLKSSTLSVTCDGDARRVRALAFKVLLGEIRNEYRARKRRQALVQRTAVLDPWPEHAHDSHDDVIDRQLIAHWLSQLPTTDQQLILLVNADFAMDEIAEILGCSEYAAARRRTRARNRLREVLGTVRTAAP